MSRAERTIKDAAKLYSSQILGAVVALIFSAWLVRHLPSAELSLWPVCFTLTAIVQVLTCMGVGDFLVRVVPGAIQDGDVEYARGVIRTSLLLNLSLSTLACIGVFFLADVTTATLLNDEVPGTLVRMLTAVVFFSVMHKHAERALFAIQSFGLAAIIQFMVRVLRAPLAVAFYLLWGIEGAVGALSLVAFGAAAAAIVGLWPFLFGVRQRVQTLELTKRSFPFYVAALANLGATRLDYLVLGLLTTPASLAAYYVARRIADYLRQLDAAVLEAITPKLSEQRSHSRHKIEDVFVRCTRYLLLGLLPIHVGVAATANAIIRLYAGDRYPIAGTLLALLALACLLEAIAGLLRANIQVFAGRWRLAALDATSGVASVALSAALVFLLGPAGVPVAQSITYLASSLLGVLLLRTTLTPRVDMHALVTAGVANAVLAVVVLAAVKLISGVLGLLLAIVIGSVAYLITLRRRLSPQDIDLVVRITPAPLTKVVCTLAGCAVPSKS